jgi:anti-anti-sigma factor
MDVKIDTKEKFHVITVPGPVLTADMAGGLAEKLPAFLGEGIRNVVLNLKEITETDELSGKILVQTQQQFYEKNASFVVCEMQKRVEEFLDEKNLLELMNSTPSESEAWDIIQMEEIERELLDDENP